MRRLGLLACLLAGPALAVPPTEPTVETALLAEAPGVTPGGSVRIGLELKTEPGWHTYWRNPGESGTPTEIAWTLPPGAAAGPIEWPVPQVIREGDIAVFAYEGRVVLPSRIRAPADAKPGAVLPIKALAYWVVCKDICVPGEAELAITLPVVAAAVPIAHPFPAPPTAREGWSGRLSLEPGNLVLALSTGGDTLIDATFLPHLPGRVTPGDQQQLTATLGRAELRLPRAPELRQPIDRLDGLLLATVKGQPQPLAITIEAVR